MADTLLLIPTELEWKALGPAAPGLQEPEFCGVGIAESAVLVARLLERRRPDRVLLIGIAGSYDLERWPVATAREASQVTLIGVGAHVGHEVVPIRAQATSTTQVVLPLESTSGLPMLTVAAAADEDMAERRRARHPDAIGEEMEGAAIAMACAAQQIPFTMIRGCSNLAGDRTHSRWDIQGAMRAAWELAKDYLSA